MIINVKKHLLSQLLFLQISKREQCKGSTIFNGTVETYKVQLNHTFLVFYDWLALTLINKLGFSLVRLLLRRQIYTLFNAVLLFKVL